VSAACARRSVATEDARRRVLARVTCLLPATLSVSSAASVHARRSDATPFTRHEHATLTVRG